MLLGDAITSCFIAAVFGSLAILVFRYVFYIRTYERVRLYLRRRGPGYEMYTPVVTEEVWEVCGVKARWTKQGGRVCVLSFNPADVVSVIVSLTEVDAA